MSIKHLLLLLLSLGHLVAQDPYENIQQYRLENGMHVVLNPNANSKDVMLTVRVGVGMYHEDKKSLGASHLLEHVLFLDEHLPKAETYLEILKENGAAVNASTSTFTTEYFATIEAKKLDLILHTYSKALLDRRLAPLKIENERQSIAIEIGKIDYFTRLLGVDFEQFFEHDYFPKPNIFTSEFGFEFPRLSMNKVRKNTKTLSLEALQKHYDTFYATNNMVLFLSGAFDPIEAKKMIQKYYGSKRDSYAIIPSDPVLTPRPRLFMHVTHESQGAPRIMIGTKYHDLAPIEKLVLTLYFEDLSNRMMKKLRNENGVTYTVSPFHDKILRSGIQGISFDTTKESFEENYDYIRSLIHQETQEYGLSKEMFESAKEYFYKQEFDYVKTNAQDLMQTAKEQYEFTKDYAIDQDWYTLFTALDYKTYQKSLKELFAPNKRFTLLYANAVLFENDKEILSLFFMIFAILLLKKIFTARFSCVDITFESALYSRSTRILIAPILIFITFIVYVLLSVPMSYYLFDAPLFNTLNATPEYLLALLKTLLFVLLFFMIAGMFKNRLLVSNSALLFIGARSYTLKRDTIQSIEQIDPSLKLFFKRRSKNFGFLWGWNKKVVKITTPIHEVNVWLKEPTAFIEHLA